MKNKILFDARTINWPGNGSYVKNILKNIKCTDNISLLGNKKYFSDFGDFNLVQYNYEANSIHDQLALPYYLENFDLIHFTHYIIPLVYNFVKRRFWVSIHDVFLISEQCNYINKVIKEYIRLNIKTCARKAERILTISDFSKNEIIKYTGCDPDKIEVVYCGIGDIYKKLGRSELDIFAGEKKISEKFILFVGNIKPHKNIKNIIKSFSILKRKYNVSHKLYLVGEFDKLYTSYDYSKDLDDTVIKDIKYLGRVSDEELVGYYNLADVFLFPSLYEGFGIPPLEAMSCECPVVSSDFGAMKEVLKDSAYLVDSLSPLEIADAVYTLISDPQLRNRFINKGLDHIRNFSWRKAAERIEQLYSAHD